MNTLLRVAPPNQPVSGQSMLSELSKNKYSHAGPCYSRLFTCSMLLQRLVDAETILHRLAWGTQEDFITIQNFMALLKFCTHQT